MSLKRRSEHPPRWLVISGSPRLGYAHYGPFASEAEAADFRDDWIAQGAEWAEVAELHDPDAAAPTT